MSDDQDVDTSALAAELCVVALSDHNDPTLAILTLMQAAASLCVVRLKPAAFAVEVFTGAAQLQLQQLASLLRPDRVRQ